MQCKVSVFFGWFLVTYLKSVGNLAETNRFDGIGDWGWIAGLGAGLVQLQRLKLAHDKKHHLMDRFSTKQSWETSHLQRLPICAYLMFYHFLSKVALYFIILNDFYGVRAVKHQYYYFFVLDMT